MDRKIPYIVVVLFFTLMPNWQRIHTDKNGSWVDTAKERTGSFIEKASSSSLAYTMPGNRVLPRLVGNVLACFQILVVVAIAIGICRNKRQWERLRSPSLWYPEPEQP
jgi:hypothetical protein